MTLPPSFTTQSLGELQLQEGNESYRPTNQNKHRFLFQPEKNINPTSWISLIDQRVPALNSQWPTLLASAADKLKSSLTAVGQSSLGSDATLKHITLNGEGEALLLVALSESEEALLLEAAIDKNGLVQSIHPTR